jgi:hypothetical protein
VVVGAVVVGVVVDGVVVGDVVATAVVVADEVSGTETGADTVGGGDVTGAAVVVDAVAAAPVELRVLLHPTARTASTASVARGVHPVSRGVEVVADMGLLPSRPPER